MSFSSVHLSDYIPIFMVQNRTLKNHIIVYISFLKDGIDLNFKKLSFDEASPWSEDSELYNMLF